MQLKRRPANEHMRLRTPATIRIHTLAAAPPLDSAGCLGLIVTCLNRGCCFRNWLDLCDLPPGITAPSVAQRARCSACGHKGAHVEVIQPKSAMGLAGGVPVSDNTAHAVDLKHFIRQNPYGAIRWELRKVVKDSFKPSTSRTR
jgi:hypothetical protein